MRMTLAHVNAESKFPRSSARLRTPIYRWRSSNDKRSPSRDRSDARSVYFAADVQTVCHRSNNKAIAYCQIVAAIKRFHTGYPGQT